MGFSKRYLQIKSMNAISSLPPQAILDSPNPLLPPFDISLSDENFCKGGSTSQQQQTSLDSPNTSFSSFDNNFSDEIPPSFQILLTLATRNYSRFPQPFVALI